MKNLLWRSGMLRSRKGQFYLSDTQLGQGFAAYERLWHGFVFAHIGECLYCFDAESGGSEQLSSGIPQVRGTFFLYGDALYYKTRGAYKVITAEENGGEWSFSCSTVVPYEPVIVINASPYPGAGDLYQPENRMSARKTVWYNAVDRVKTYHLPVLADRVIRVEVNGIVLTTGWTYSPYAGTVTFRDAPPVTDPPPNTTVRITYELVNQEAQVSLYDCRYAAVYGGTGELCVVMAGSVSQPNAYYWSGNSNLKIIYGRWYELSDQIRKGDRRAVGNGIPDAADLQQQLQLQGRPHGGHLFHPICAFERLCPVRHAALRHAE